MIGELYSVRALLLGGPLDGETAVVRDVEYRCYHRTDETMTLHTYRATKAYLRGKRVYRHVKTEPLKLPKPPSIDAPADDHPE